MAAKIIAFPNTTRRSPLSLSAIRAIEAIVRVDARYRNSDLAAHVAHEFDGLVLALEALAGDTPVRG